MATAALTQQTLKRTFKEALAETLQEHRGLLREVFAETLEDFLLSEAIREGRKTKRVPREQVLKVLRGKG